MRAARARDLAHGRMSEFSPGGTAPAAARLQCIARHTVASSASPAPSGTASIAEEFARAGVVVLPNFFSATELAPVRAAFAGLLADTPIDASTAVSRGAHKGRYKALFETELVSLSAQLAGSQPAREAVETLLASQRLHAATATVLGGNGYSRVGLLAFAYGKGMGHGWHQDSGSDEPGQFVLNRLVYFQGIEADQGHLHYVPCSQTRHLADDPGPNHGPIRGEAALLPAAGTLVLMHTRCYHRVGTNTLDQPRVMLNSRVAPPGAAKEVTRYPVFRSQTWDHTTGLPW
eukprot:SAG22_NODE_591_length_8819_cov_3.667737_3_plen_289_part_00